MTTPTFPRHPPADERVRGLVYGLGAYLFWGLAPVYFKALKAASPLEIASHRAVWSVVVLLLLALVNGRWRGLRGWQFSWERLGVYLGTTTLITGNWLLYIWAVNSGRLVEASLGYFINPLVNVLLGAWLLKEPLNRLQLGAIALATGGVLYMVAGYGTFPTISLGLAVSFALYGLLRKKAGVDPQLGLLIETALVAPLAVSFLIARALQGEGAFYFAGTWTTVLLAMAGVVTATPLVWFSHGVRRLPLSTMGFLQYVTPTCGFLLAVLLYDEPFTMHHAVVFGCIWASLIVYSADALLKARSRATSP